jgi:hypothetical protein
MSEQQELPMLTVYHGPRFIDRTVVEAIKTYREAVRACWALRTRRSLTKTQLAVEAGLYASHVSDYISESPTKRELPAKGINQFEIGCGNRIITQWLNMQAHVTVLEEFTSSARRVA